MNPLEAVAKCTHCGGPSDGAPCDECAPVDHWPVTKELPVVGGLADGQTAPATIVAVTLAPTDPLRALSIECPYVRRPFIVGDPIDLEMSHMIVVFIPADDPDAIVNAGMHLQTIVHAFAWMAYPLG